MLVVARDSAVRTYALPLSITGGAIALWHSGLYFGLVPQRIAPCTKDGPSCTDAAMVIAGLPIPVLSLVAFAAITLALALMKGSRT